MKLAYLKGSFTRYSLFLQVKNYKCPSEKDMKHINRKLKSCLGHSSSHDEYTNNLSSTNSFNHYIYFISFASAIDSLLYLSSSGVRNGRRDQNTSPIGAPMIHQTGHRHP